MIIKNDNGMIVHNYISFRRCNLYNGIPQLLMLHRLHEPCTLRIHIHHIERKPYQNQRSRRMNGIWDNHLSIHRV